MLLKIDVRPEDIIFNENGRIIIKLHYYSEFATAAHICTVKGETKEDFDKNGSQASKNVFVGQRGGITLEN